MANEIITATRGTGISAVMNQALSPFRLLSPERPVREALDFLETDETGEMICLDDNADWPASRAKAIELKGKLFPIAEINAAIKALEPVVTVKSPLVEYEALAARMLDVIGINGGDGTDAYLEALVWQLTEIEEADGTIGWIPLAAFARVVKRVWADPEAWSHFGGTKRPPIPEVIQQAKEGRTVLIRKLSHAKLLASIHKRLDLVVEAVKGYEEDW